MHTGVLWQVVYWLALPVRGLLIAVLLWRRLVKKYPAFFFYLLVAELCNIARLIAFQKSQTVYFYTYWSTDSLVAAFALIATYELCLRRLFVGFQRVGFYRALFPVGAIPVAGIGILAAFLIVSGYKKVGIFVQIAHAFDALRVAMLFLFVALMIIMGRAWKRHEFAIGVGLGIDAVGLLVVSGAFARFPFIRPIAGRLGPLASDLACIIWLASFLRPAEELPVDGDSIDPKVIIEARRSETELKAWLRDKKTSSDSGNP